MKEAKKDASKIGMSSPNVEGQGTTTTETGSTKVDSSRKKHKRS
ncbi:MAG TPA: YuzL family protein [Bacillus sp. (in: firmicutes)]|nr:YuzL family protein [Bacillus litorisediminis]HWO77082.1 YuzL family protein [Bacillus sp. (in: firmicutes)]